MQATNSLGEALQVGETFIAALVGRDFAALEDCFHPEVHFRALIPPGIREATTAAGGVEHMRRWFADADHHELLRSAVETVADRLHVAYRFKVHDADGWQIIEQQAFADVREGRITHIDLLCTGFRVVAPD